MMDTDEQAAMAAHLHIGTPAPQGDQAPATRNLTIIWDEERKEILERLDAHAKLIEDLNERMRTLETWALRRGAQPRREPQTPGAGIGHAVPKSVR